MPIDSLFDDLTDAFDVGELETLESEPALVDSSAQSEDPRDPPDKRPDDPRFAQARAKVRWKAEEAAKAKALKAGFFPKDWEKPGLAPRPAWMGNSSLLPKRPPGKV
jgi:hypothetical protein